MRRAIIAIDPSEWGTSTSGCGIAVGIQEWTKDMELVTILSVGTVFGKQYNNNIEYTTGVINSLDAIVMQLKELSLFEIIVRVEQFINYGTTPKGVSENGVSEMIGAIKQWVLDNNLRLEQKKAATIKTRWPENIMENYKIIRAGGIATIMRVIRNPLGKPKTLLVDNYTLFNKRVKHSFDAYRHLIDELLFINKPLINKISKIKES